MIEEIYKIANDFKIDKRFWTKTTLSGEEQDTLRSKPAPYLKTAIKIANYMGLKTVVEIGSMRYAVTQPCLDYFNENNNAYHSPSCCCDGHGSFFWAENGYDVYTVDIDENCLNGVKWCYSNLKREFPENMHPMIPKDGIEFLKEFESKIDVLYLDGWDVGTPEYAEKHLEAYLAAKDKLSDSHMILIDDTDFINEQGGKDKLLSPQLISEGYLPIFNGRQTCFIKYKDPKVIVSLTTVPNRLNAPNSVDSIKRVIDKITSQRYPNYEVHFNIPYIHNKTGEEYIIPEWLSEYSKENLKIFRTEDYKSLTKLLPTVQRINNPKTIIITVDDDLEYEDGFIEYHLRQRIKYPNSAIGFAGIGSIGGNCHFCTTVNKDIRVKILEGYKTISYKRSFFGDDFAEFSIGNWNDDMIISAYLGKNYITKMVVSYEGDKEFSPKVESYPVIRHLPNERGGCFLFRNEEIPDGHEEYYKLGYLER
jgi:hypothetical protein